MVTAEVTEPSITSKVGINFETSDGGHVHVSYVAGLFAETGKWLQ